MGKFFKRLSLVPRGLRHKLMVAFALMAIIPLLICVWLFVNYILPTVETVWDVSMVIFFAIVVALLGLGLARGIVDPIIRLAVEAKVIAEGDLERKIEVKREDEIGDLERSLNIMTNRLKANMAEIQSYSDKIRMINLDINKKAMALSGLLQVGTTLSITPQLDVVLPLVVDRLSQVAEAQKVFLMLVDRDTDELQAKYFHQIEPKAAEELHTKIGEGFLGKVARSEERLVLDSSTRPTKAAEEFLEKQELKNLCLIPISSRGRVMALIGVGNNLPDFSYQRDDLELLNIFARQVAIAVENDWLLKRTEELAVTDELTGLYNESYMRERLAEEIKRAITYQRPCSFVMFNVDDFKKYEKDNSELAGEAVLKKVAEIIRENIEEIDKPARPNEDNFALILPEKNKGEAKEIAERIREAVEKYHFPGERTQPAGKLTISAGVSANPIDGITTEDLINKALVELLRAKSEGKNRVAL